MFVRLFIDENLDRLVPISKQPKDKISAIIQSCQRQFPEFADRARKRIRTYLKSCRRTNRLREPNKRHAEPTVSWNFLNFVYYSKYYRTHFCNEWYIDYPNLQGQHCFAISSMSVMSNNINNFLIIITKIDYQTVSVTL